MEGKRIPGIGIGSHTNIFKFSSQITYETGRTVKYENILRPGSWTISDIKFYKEPRLIIIVHENEENDIVESIIKNFKLFNRENNMYTILKG